MLADIEVLAGLRSFAETPPGKTPSPSFPGFLWPPTLLRLRPLLTLWNLFLL